MLKKLLSGLNQKKVKVFSLFLLCSSLAWLISNLSESYESRANFSINYRNLPDSLLLGTHSEEQIEAKLRANGFQFLYYNFFKQRMDIDISQVAYQNGRYVLDEAPLKRQMEQQLSQNISLIELDRRQLAVDLYQVDTKIIPVEAKLDLRLQQNFILDGKLRISPDSVQVKGPKNEIDTIQSIKTVPIQLTNVNSDFSNDAALVFPKGLDNTIFSVAQVKVSGKVSKFSEKVFEVPIKGLNFPEGYQVKIFPNSVTVLCKATIDRLKEISATDFEIVADYSQLNGSTNSTLFLELSQKPENVYDLRMEENTVNFVLEQP
ncbi:CdaR family protein [Flagellimonas zhangzhouensis]|uniref:YbbR-like protein n=1 Tax=Flagellimonas zhangzhouensis TaxID=1073328 RepID=A0A1H2S0K6_9FLAO|nr:YbbR-like domain-containing protein [Allomuricauda zhangzhouensis]SDQ69489.1 YbbR-like protein [Allomuricauda zhangzhouensis]SDW25262.1 YbbR-like protein [Allomuricauda zhangzhouensis]